MRAVQRKTLTFSEAYEIDRSTSTSSAAGEMKSFDLDSAAELEQDAARKANALPAVCRKYNAEIKSAAGGKVPKVDRKFGRTMTEFKSTVGELVEVTACKPNRARKSISVMLL